MLETNIMLNSMCGVNKMRGGINKISINFEKDS